MNPERWAQIEELFHRAAEYAPEKRGVFLEKECAGDLELRKEIESLLASDLLAAHQMQAALRDTLRTVDFPLVGQTASHYRILEGLGGGGMGIVYLGEDIKLGRRVAVKFLPEESARDSVALGRFEREARSASALEHPNICPIYEFGEHLGQPFLVMQLLEGRTLRELISKGAPGRCPISLDQLLALASQIADGLDAAHQKGIIHRDIKPANIFVTTRGEAKILDFGLAKLASSVSASSEAPDLDFLDDYAKTASDPPGTEKTPDPFLSRTGMAMGTAGYMSPEQARGEKLDARTDLFSFGLVLYEMATGQRAFKGDTGPALHQAILNQMPVRARELSSSVPGKLEAIIGKLLEKDRSSRYQSAAEVRSDLEKLRVGLNPNRRLQRWGIAVGSLLVVSLIFLLWLISYRASTRKGLPELKLQQLTSNSDENAVISGKISPDGKLLAYSDKSGIKIKTLNGGAVVPIPQPAELKAKAISWQIAGWFPGNANLVANAYPSETPPFGPLSSQEASVWKISLEDRTLQKLRDAAFAHSVSPDGSWIAFGTQRGNLGDRELWLMDPAGGNPRKLYGTDEESAIIQWAWNRDGKQAIYLQANSTQSTLLSGDMEGSTSKEVLPTSVTSALQDYLWLPDGRLIYSSVEPKDKSGACNFWEVSLDRRTGKSSGTPRRLTSWSDFCMDEMSATSNGKELAFLKSATHETAYTADLDPTGSFLSNPRHFSVDGSGIIIGWAADSNAIYYTSDANGHVTIFAQNPGEEIPRTIAEFSENVESLQLSPDGKFIFYFPSAKPGSIEGSSAKTRDLYRVPVSEGASERVLTAIPDALLRCSKAQTHLCVMAETSESDRRKTFTAFYPDNGRTSELFQLEVDPEAYPWLFALSPDGKHLATFRSSAGPINVFSLDGQIWKTITIKGWSNIRDLQWTADGKGLFIASDTNRPEAAALLHVDLQGNASVLWKNLMVDSFATSPDGRHLAFGGLTRESNIWTIENF